MNHRRLIRLRIFADSPRSALAELDKRVCLYDLGAAVEIHAKVLSKCQRASVAAYTANLLTVFIS